MTNLSKIKRDQMIAFLESLKESHSDDASIQAFNEIENHIRDKKYGLVWEEHSEEVDALLKENIPILTADTERRLCKDASLPWNFIIEGDNLQALYLLEKTHKGKVDCIYIDPPYNTGARDWKYNNDYVVGTDTYRHSKWLSMMRNRLLIAKNLLNPYDSVLICTIDEKEYLRLGCLLEELFPEAGIQMITTVINPKGNRRDNEFSRCEEFIFFVTIGDAALVPNGSDMLRQQRDGKETINEVEDDNGTGIRLRALLRQASNHGRRQDRPNLFYPLLFEKETGVFLGAGPVLSISDRKEDYIAPNNAVAMWPIGANGAELTWNLQPETLMRKHSEHFLSFGKWNGKTRTGYYLSSGQEENFRKGMYAIVGYDDDGAYILRQKGNVTKAIRPLTVWNKKEHSASDYGTTLLNRIIGSGRFPFPKSLYAVYDTIKFFVSDKPNAVIVDFFAGSGTTFHAVNLMNAVDNGRRTCILSTNNEVSDEEEKRLKRQGLNKGDPEWEQYGIAQYVTWPRTKCTIEGVDINGKALRGDYLTESVLSIPMAQGFLSNVKYFKCSWTPRKPEDYLLSNALCLHIKEMIELQNAIEVDNVKNVLILNKEDFKHTILNADVRPHIERVWVNQNIIFSTEELKALKKIGYKYIPREFFGQELREAAE